MKTWQNGDPITYEDLNYYEKLKAYCNGTLDMTTLTYQEAVQIQEMMCVPNVNYYYDGQKYVFNVYDVYTDSLTSYYAAGTTNYLTVSRPSAGTA